MLTRNGTNTGIPGFKKALLDLALSHPSLGIGKAKVPVSLLKIQEKLQELKTQKHYLLEQEYQQLCSSIDIPKPAL